MADYQNKISILITAQNLSSAEIEKSAAQVEAAQAKVAASSEESAATTVAANEKVAASSGAVSKQVGIGSAAIAAAVVVGVGAMVKAAGDYQAAVTRLATSAGESRSNLKMVSDGILQIARDTGTATSQLTSAMYTIESGGYHGAAGLTILKAAAQGAKTENAELATVADAVTSAMTDYHLSANQAANVTSKLVAATGQGKTTFQDLAGAMSAILPRASAAGIALNEILGDLASMTLHGISAQQAAENLADAIAHLQSPTMAMSKEMAALGLNSTELSQNLGKKGLYGSIQEISQAIQSQMGKGSTAVILDMENALKGLPKSVQDISQQVINGTASWGDWNKATKDLTVTQRSQAQAFATLFNGMHTIGTEQMTGAQVMQTYAGAMNKAMGDSAGLNVALMLTGENTRNTTRSIQAVSAATAEAGGNVKGWSEIQENFNQQMSVLKEDLGTTAIAIGQALLPPLTTLAKGLDDILRPLSSWISNNKDLTAGIVLIAGGLATFVAVTWAAQKATNALGSSYSLVTGLGKKFAESIGLINSAEETGALTKVTGELGAIGKLGAEGKIATTAADVAKVGVASSAAEEGAAGLATVLTGPVGIGLLAATAGGIALYAIWKKLHDQSEQNKQQALSGAQALQEYTNAQNANNKASQDLTTAKKKLSDADQVVSQRLKQVQKDQDAVTNAYNKYGDNSPQYAQALEKLANDTGKLTKAQQDQKRATDDVKNAEDALKKSNSDLSKANNDVEKSTTTLSTYENKLVKDHQDLQKAALAVKQAQADVDGTYKMFGANSPQYQQAVRQLAKAHEDLDQAEKNTKADGQALVNFENGVIQQANGWITKYQAVSKAGQNAQKALGYAVGPQGVPVPKFASGTNYAPGGLSLVGENGPELVNLPTGSKVMPTGETQSMLGSRGGKGVYIANLNVYNNTDAGLVARQIGWQLAMA